MEKQGADVTAIRLQRVPEDREARDQPPERVWTEFTLAQRLPDLTLVTTVNGASTEVTLDELPPTSYQEVYLNSLDSVNDSSPQHALLDDDGVWPASHVLSQRGGDGARSTQVFLGTNPNGPEKADLMRVCPSVHLVGGAPSPTLWAEFDRLPGALVTAWIEIKQPTYEGPDVGGTMQHDMALSVVHYSSKEQVGDAHSRWLWREAATRDYPAGTFDEPGIYQILYFGEESGYPEPAEGMYSWVFRASGNGTPSAFDLQEPEPCDEPGEDVESPVVFRWSESVSSAGVVQYLLRIWLDETRTELYYEAALRRQTLAVLDHSVLQDNGEGESYWWDVLAVDVEGNTTRSALRPLVVETTNAALGYLTGLVVDADTGEPIPGAKLHIDHGTAVDVGMGGYARSVEAGTYTLTVTAEHYAPLTLAGVEIQGGVVRNDFALEFLGRELRLPLEAGWNLVSLPIDPYEPAIEAVFADPDTRGGIVCLGVVWGWDGATYYRATEIEAMHGYWVYVLEDVELLVKGDLVVDPTRQLGIGWNLIGPADFIEARQPAGTVGPYRGYDDGVFVNPADVPAPFTGLLKQSRAYWIYAAEAGEVYLGP